LIKISKGGKILAAVAGCEAVGIIGGIASVTNIDGWYSNLQKPVFNPPNYIFGPIWTVLYLFMGIAAGLVWSGTGEAKLKRKSLQLFGIQLALNFGWSFIFFGWHNPELALTEILVLLVTLGWTIKSFWKLNRQAAYLLIPYLIWVSFASVLNFFIVRLN
jgi:translocator protein